jgi:hypothetical protein
MFAQEITWLNAPSHSPVVRPQELSTTDVAHVAGGSQSSGAGAGKITFNPFSITRKIDCDG